MKFLLFSLLIFTYFSYPSCLEMKDEMGFKWAKKEGKGVIGKYNQYTSSSISTNSDIGWTLAKGKALEMIVSDCGSLPVKVEIFEKCQDEDREIFKSYIRVSVEKRNCSKNKKSNKQLVSDYKKYQELVTRANKLKKLNCLDDNSCYSLALKLLDTNRVSDSKDILRKSCMKGEFSSCMLLIEIENNKKESISLLGYVCKNDSKRACFKKYELSGSLKDLEKSCHLGYKLGCLRLLKVRGISNVSASDRIAFCNSGMSDFCKNKKPSEDVEIYEGSVKELDL